MNLRLTENQQRGACGIVLGTLIILFIGHGIIEQYFAPPKQEGEWARRFRLKGIAEVAITNACQKMVGFQRIMDVWIDDRNEDPVDWNGTATVDYINRVGGITRTNLVFIFKPYDNEVWPMEISSWQKNPTEQTYRSIYQKPKAKAEIIHTETDLDRSQPSAIPVQPVLDKVETLAKAMDDSSDKVLADMRHEESNRLAIIAAKTLNWQQEQASNGSAYCQFKMGVHYVEGDGVPKDLKKAREYFQKSSDQGYADATEALVKLPTK